MANHALNKHARIASGWANCSLMGLPWLTELYRIFSLLPWASHRTVSQYHLQYHLLDQGVVTFMSHVEWNTQVSLTVLYKTKHCTVRRHYKRAVNSGKKALQQGYEIW